MSGCEEEAAAVQYGMTVAYKKLLIYMESVQGKYGKDTFSLVDVSDCITQVLSGKEKI